MALYKLTKGTISVIRVNREAVAQAEADGYKLDGEVNAAYEVINPCPFAEPVKRGKPSKVESDGE